MTAVHAFEDLYGIEIDPSVRALRRLLYCGEWIQSHALHVYLLHAPDFLGYPSALAMAADHREVVEQGLAIKKVGNELIAALGGRPVHPRLGAGGRVLAGPAPEGPRPGPAGARRRRRAGPGDGPSRGVVGTPALSHPQPLVAMRHPDEYPYNDGRIVSTDGLDIAPGRLGRRSSRSCTSRARTPSMRGRTTARSTCSGPTARIALTADTLHPLAAEALAETGLADAIRVNIHRSIVARAVELLHACAEARDLIDGYRPPAEPRVAFTPRPGIAAWSTEAPRGLLHHRYEVDAQGHVVHAQIVPPTSQNQGAIEADLTAFAPSVLDLPHAEATHRLEMLIRAYDPCISCATHFLDLRIVDAGREEGNG